MRKVLLLITSVALMQFHTVNAEEEKDALCQMGCLVSFPEFIDRTVQDMYTLDPQSFDTSRLSQDLDVLDANINTLHHVIAKGEDLALEIENLEGFVGRNKLSGQVLYTSKAINTAGLIALDLYRSPVWKNAAKNSKKIIIRRSSNAKIIPGKNYITPNDTKTLRGEFKEVVLGVVLPDISDLNDDISMIMTVTEEGNQLASNLTLTKEGVLYNVNQVKQKLRRLYQARDVLHEVENLPTRTRQRCAASCLQLMRDDIDRRRSIGEMQGIESYVNFAQEEFDRHEVQRRISQIRQYNTDIANKIEKSNEEVSAAFKRAKKDARRNQLKNIFQAGVQLVGVGIDVKNNLDANQSREDILSKIGKVAGDLDSQAKALKSEVQSLKNSGFSVPSIYLLEYRSEINIFSSEGIVYDVWGTEETQEVFLP